ncbi:unnamed protein product [Rhizoctonia solani]|uniref:Uncharacterized protein n=1 Tax=Rhizoctonia solani TaxID=456999 RepID=A0A8H2WBM5_9AGAM|nr:unnamed protein product [Rhizoctonia solani]
MTTTTHTPADFEKQVSQTFSTKKQLDDQVAGFMYKTNWADLLGPAPTVILILGRLLQLGTVVDFPLSMPEKPDHLKYPFFGASIAHLANSGTNAMTDSRSQMESINSSSNNIIESIKKVFRLLGTATGDDIPRFLPGLLNEVTSASAICLAEAQAMQKGWYSVLGLAQELQEVCRSTRGETETLRLQAEARIKYLEAQKKNEEENFKKAEEWVKTTKERLETSHTIVKEAIDKIPDAWTIGMMGLAQGLTNAAQTGLEAFINEQCFKSQMGDLAKEMSEAVGHKPNGSSGDKSGSGSASTKPESETESKPESTTDPESDPKPKPTSKPTRRSNDPGYAVAEAINAGFVQFKDLLNGDEGIKWDLVDDVDKNGLLAIRAVFQTHSEKAIGNRASELACDLMNEIKVTKPEPEIEKLVETVNHLADESRDFALEAKITVGSSGGSNLILNGGPTIHFSNSSSWAKIDAEAAQTRVQYAQSYLATNGQLHKEATDDFLDISRRMADFKGQLDRINVNKVNWDLVAQILNRAITFLGKLNQSLHKLVSYFNTIHFIVREAADSKVKYLTGAITAATASSVNGKTSELSHGAFKVTNFGKQLLYDQSLGAVKITRVVQRVSALYIKMYDLHIKHGVEMLDEMGGLTKDNKPEELSQAEKNISEWVTKSQKGMEELVMEESTEIEKHVLGRVEEIERAFSNLLPPVDQGIQKAITKAGEEFVKNETQEIKENSTSQLILDDI